MISLKRLIQLPKSPERAIEQAYSIAEAAVARIAHVNRLSRDIMDIKSYELDIITSTTLRISSKKGIVELVNFDSEADIIDVYLQHQEIEVDREKFYLQLTVYSSGNAVPIIFGRGMVNDVYHVQIVDIQNNQNWGDLYFYYEIVKID
jgi:hypothetical protein